MNTAADPSADLEPAPAAVDTVDSSYLQTLVGYTARFARHPRRRELQVVFQDPTESLNPRYSAADCIAEPLRLLVGLRDRAQIAARVEEAAREVGLPAALLNRFPHQLSGGQKARVNIARAVAVRPRLMILDEPTAALDVSVQAIVLDLLADLRRRHGLSYLFVSHDLNVVRLMCDRVMVMCEGRLTGEVTGDDITQENILAYATHLDAA